MLNQKLQNIGTQGICLLLLLTVMGTGKPSYAQTSTPSPVEPSLSLTDSQGQTLTFPLSDSQHLVEANTVAKTLLAMDAPPEAIAIALSLVETGGQPEAILTLMQNLQSLVTEQNQVRVYQLNNAIAAYNRVVDTSNVETLQKLKDSPNFQAIKYLLQKLSPLTP